MNATPRAGLDGLRVIGDIGGTHARFALARHGAYSHLQRVDVAKYHSLFEALRDYLAALPPELTPSVAVIDIAGPVRGDHVKMTNLAWSFSADDMKHRLGLKAFRVLNDFAAAASSIPYLPQADCFPIGPDISGVKGPIGVVGPGTGLGVGALVPGGDGWTLIPGEGGHVSLPPSSEIEDRILVILRKRFGHVSAERALSGMGLVNLYQALCEIDGVAAAPFTPADVTDHAIRGTDPICVKAFAHFCEMLGTVAGDLALTLGASGGIYIAGGILLRFKEAFAASGFRARFESKGRFRDWLQTVPTRLILEESPALLGLANVPIEVGV
ncbi:MAG: glucokinase [Afipia felis]|nr:glucokinase [Afipia felis]